MFLFFSMKQSQAIQKIICSVDNASHYLLCSFGLIEKNQKIRDGMIAPRIRPGQHIPL